MLSRQFFVIGPRFVLSPKMAKFSCSDKQVIFLRLFTDPLNRPVLWPMASVRAMRKQKAEDFCPQKLMNPDLIPRFALE